MKSESVDVMFKELLLRKHAILVPEVQEGKKPVDSKYVLAFLKNLESYGYTVDETLFKAISNLPYIKLVSLYAKTFAVLEDKFGTLDEAEVFYPNFPREVQELSDAELFINAIVHYFSCGTLLPNYPKEERFPLVWSPKLKVLTVGTESDFVEMVKSLIMSKAPISVSDYTIIESSLVLSKDYSADGLKYTLIPSYKDYLPETIYQKEIVAFVCQILYMSGDAEAQSMIKGYIKTATDLLRFMTNLQRAYKIMANKGLSKTARKLILGILDNLNNPIEDMYRYKTEWIRAGEVLHPGAYSKRFKNANKYFTMLREGKKPLFFGGAVAEAINNADVHKAVDLLKSRPGEFARRLDKLVSMCELQEDLDYVLSVFKQVGATVSTRVLWQLYAHFVDRAEDMGKVVYNPIKSYNMFVKEDTRKPLDKKIIAEVQSCIVDVLTQAYKGGDPVSIYVEKEFDNFKLPLELRNVNCTGRVFTRGSQFNIEEEANILRLFINWTNLDNSDESFGKNMYDDEANEIVIDLDLSVTMFNSDWRKVGYVDYLRLRDNGVTHSGDIVNGGSPTGNGAAEFIDIDLEKAKESGFRFFVASVQNYSGIPFMKMENARFGWMERKDAESGDIVEYRTIKHNSKLATNTTLCTTVIVDTEERSVTWVDSSLKLDSIGILYGGINVSSNSENLKYIAESIYKKHRCSLLNLIAVKGQASGSKFVSNPMEADIIFTTNESIKEELGADNLKGKLIYYPWDIDYFLKEL